MDPDALEAAARARFVRWDPRLWRAILGGPAAALAAGLDRTVGVAGTATLESYLRLTCEGVGLGYLFPAEVGREGFMNLAFLELVPPLLPSAPAERHAAILADLWNLGENLESAAPWLRRIFLRLFKGLPGLADLEARVADVERQALAPPESARGAAARRLWIPLAPEDRRFLPGAVHFVAPTVACVHDRARPGVSQGVWLAQAPLLLGPMGCSDSPPATRPVTGPEDPDPRLTASYASVANPWRVAATLVTSQSLLAWL